MNITRPINSDNLPRGLVCVFATLNFTKTKPRGKLPVMGDIRTHPWEILAFDNTNAVRRRPLQTAQYPDK